MLFLSCGCFVSHVSWLVLNNCLENALTLCLKSLFIWPKLGIPSHLCDLRLSVSSGCGQLGCRAFVFFKEPLLNGTRAHTHTHTKSHLYIEVLAFSSQTKLTLRDLNFHSIRTPQ